MRDPRSAREETHPILAAPIVAFMAMMIVLAFAQVLPQVRARGALPAKASLATFFGQ